MALSLKAILDLLRCGSLKLRSPYVIKKKKLGVVWGSCAQLTALNLIRFRKDMRNAGLSRGKENRYKQTLLLKLSL